MQWVCAVAGVSLHHDSDAVGCEVVTARWQWAVTAPSQALAAVTGELCTMTLVREEHDGTAVPSSVHHLMVGEKMDLTGVLDCEDQSPPSMTSPCDHGHSSNVQQTVGP